MKKLTALILSLATLMSITGCGSKDSADPATSENNETTDSYKIALYAPMTGNNAQYGETYKAVCDILVEKINSEGGINGVPVELAVYDDKNDPKEALNVANLIVSDPSIVGVVGSQTSSPTLAAAPIFAEAGIPMLTPQGSHADITTAGENIFSLCCLAAFEGGVVAEMMLEDGYKNLAVIYSNDDYGVNIVEKWTNDVEAGGATVVATETFVSGQTTDFTPLISKIKAAGADAIYIEPGYSDAAMILAQMKQLDCDFQPYGCSMLYKEEFLNVAGDDAEGLLLCNFIDPNNTDETYTYISQAYEEATGNLTDVYVTNAYDCFMLLCDALKAVGPDKAAMSEWIANVEDWPGACGVINFDETRHPVRELYRFKVTNGEYVSMS